MKKVDILFLGYGYVARALEKKITAENPHARLVSTSREKREGFLFFDLEDPTSWDNLPEAKLTYWSFPPTPEGLVQQFAPILQGKSEKTLVVGTTSSFELSTSPIVKEDTAFDQSKERSRAEEFLFSLGFSLVMSAGIYGPERNPLDWVRSGRVGKSEKLVNMIHIEDLVNLLIAAAQKPSPNIYIAADGNPQDWNSIISFWESKGLVSKIANKESSRLSKRVDPEQTLKDLNLDLKFRNFQEAVFSMNQLS